MGKIYKRIWGWVPKLSHIRGGGGRNTGIKRWPSANLIRKGNGGGRRAGGGKGRYDGAGYLNYYIKNNLFIIDLRIGGQPRGDLLLFTINSQPTTLKTTRKYFLILTNMPVRKLVKQNSINKKKAEIQTLKKS